MAVTLSTSFSRQKFFWLHKLLTQVLSSLGTFQLLEFDTQMFWMLMSLFFFSSTEQRVHYLHWFYEVIFCLVSNQQLVFACFSLLCSLTFQILFGKDDVRNRPWLNSFKRVIVDQPGLVKFRGKQLDQSMPKASYDRQARICVWFSLEWRLLRVVVRVIIILTLWISDAVRSCSASIIF